jgi:hypothetical protein
MGSESKENQSFSINRDFYDQKLKAAIESNFTPTHLWMLETPFATRFKKWIPQFLGGDWDYTKPNGVVPNWFNHVYQLRNRILHGGFEPDIIAGKNAFESVVALSNYVDDLLKKRNKEFPSVWELRSEVPNLFLHGEDLPPTFDID